MLRKTALFSAALAVVLAGCAGGAGLAATYEGGEVTVDEVAALIPGGDTDSVDTSQFAQMLYRVIVDEVFTAAAAEDYGVVAETAAVDAGIESIVNEVTVGGQIELEAALEGNGLTEAALEAIARQRVVFDEVQSAIIADAPEPDDAALRVQYELQLPSVANVCARHILLEDEGAANDALERALAGEDFAELAMELSTGPSGPNGGDLGCAAPSNYVTEFADATLEAEVGVAHGPVESSFGWHVILVESREVPAFEEVRETLAANQAASEATNLFNEWLTGKLADANIVVEDQYGTWTDEPSPAVIPPGV